MDTLSKQMMRRLSPLLLALLLVFVGTGLSPSAGAFPMSGSETVQLTATITAVDKDARTISVRGEDGAQQDLEVGPEVRNFDQLKAGDKVKLSYTESLLLDMQPEGKPGAYTSAMASRTPGKDGKPGATGSLRTVITAKITALDTTNHTITLLGPKGNELTFDVQDPKRQAKLKTLKVGQLIRATYDRSVAVSVSPVAAAGM